MTTLTYALTDSATMLRRNLRRAMRYPGLTVIVAALPIVFLLLFVFVFGGTLGAGLGGPAGGGRAEYVNFVMPGILLIGVAGSAQGTAIAVAMDMQEGIIARFRTMSISRGSVISGHVLSSLVQTMLGLAIVVAVGLLVGFRPGAEVTEWVAVAAVLAMAAVALIWVSVAMGLAAKSVESASNMPMLLTILPFIGSGFVPTDSMPAGLRSFAEYQPFTPIMDTVRGLLLGTPIGNSALLAVMWCAGITAFGYIWARARYERRPAR